MLQASIASRYQYLHLQESWRGVCAVAPGRAKHPTGGAIWRIDAPNDDLAGAACARQACQFIPVRSKDAVFHVLQRD